ncbi:unnamed protein product [Rotaria sp. Silwood1]|nr:unnamed protein product [Rotaria sp. Silwood1]CAF0966911.1 unnamed protein product [Rotaria sp. Silwood1]CAF3392187.1 unnamed protein product [Rotaria sp. Silwood1]CAF4620294.1 unnamed protein product [Rotaria sp. Silwood1]CAF4634900.1 unnamed protein product [Rotaria sp. Silwood1]
MYSQKNASSNYTTYCLFDIALFLRYAGTLTVILGFIGNFLSIVVFSRKALRSRSCSIYFLALNVSDIWVLIGYTLENLLYHGYGIQLLSSAFMCKSVIFLIYASTDISNYLLTLAAIDRCILISHRTAHYRFCRASTAKLLIVVVVTLFSLINSHFLFGFHIDQNGSCLPAPKQYIDFYVHHYDSYIDIMKTVLIPFIIIFICNIFIISLLTRKHNLLRRTSTQRRRLRQEKDRQLTGFLLLTSILFIVLSLPSEINDFLRTYFSRQFQIDYACQLWTSTTIFILLHQIHHASHFYVYTLTGPMFRKEFQKFICHYKNTNHKENLNDFPRRATIMSPQTNHEDTDDQRLGVFLRQTRSFSRLSFKTDV